MWTLTITYGEYHDLKTLVHESKNEHDWMQEANGYWRFSGNDDEGNIEWYALVKDVQAATDTKQVEPATIVVATCTETGHDHSTSSCLGPRTGVTGQGWTAQSM